MDFDKAVSTVIDGHTLEYGVINGNENIFFIKCGAGGDIRGYDDKYLKMARRINDSLGATVVCSSYPYPTDDSLLEYDEALIKKLMAKFDVPCTLSFIGSSRGAYVGLTYFSKRFKISKMLLINMPLMINFHKSVEALQGLSDAKVTFVYGERDPSVGYIPYLRLYHDNVATVCGADHTFEGMNDEFIELSDLIAD